MVDLDDLVARLKAEELRNKALTEFVWRVGKHPSIHPELQFHARRLADEMNPTHDSDPNPDPVLPAPPAPTNDVRTDILAYARSLLGVPYEINLDSYPRQPGRGFGKEYPPDGGLDCSGYVLQCAKHVGFLLDLDPLLTSVVTLKSRCTPITGSSALPGDVIIFRGTYITGPSHVGLVTTAGGERFISAREPRVGEDAVAGYWADHLDSYGRLPGL